MGVYAFAGGKGGVGKTTTALNVGVELGRNGYDVIVVDADVEMADLGRLLDIDTDPGIHDVLAGDAAPMEAVVDGPEAVRLLTGEADLDALGHADPAKLPQVFDHLSRFAEFVLVDTSGGLSHDVLVSLGAADGVLLLTTPKRMSLNDAARTAALIERVDGTLLGTVVTRARANTDPGEVAAETDTAVVSAVADDAAMTERAVVDSDAASDARKGYRHMAAILEAVEFADDPVSAARSVTVPKTTADDGEETATGADDAKADADEPDEEGDDEPEEDDVLGLFTTDDEPL
jgi:septum site-determining protein MinD